MQTVHDGLQFDVYQTLIAINVQCLRFVMFVTFYMGKTNKLKFFFKNKCHFACMSREIYLSLQTSNIKHQPKTDRL